MRLFFAVPASGQVRSLVREAVDSIPIYDPPWRWIPPENYHMTMKFLGEVEEDTVPSLRRAASDVAVQIAPFGISFGRFGGFPSLSRPRVIFYRVEDGAGELGSLAGRIEDAVECLGFKREHRPFRAHLTLARIKRPPGGAVVQKLGEVPPLPTSAVQTVDRFVLMRSHLSREGATYEELLSFGLTGES